MNPHALNIYTDGSCLNKPRRGGIGIRFIFPDFFKKVELTKDFSFPGYKGATNNQMELKSCIVALEKALELKELQQIQMIVIYSDSMYIVDNYKNAMFKWPKQRWRTLDNRPILNADLWKELVRIMQKTKKIINIEYVKGHSSNKDNKAVDKLAKQSARKAKDFLPLLTLVRKKKTDQMTEKGCIKMNGQKVKIRIIESKYLKIQKEYQFRYEVISKNSEFYKKVDLIFFKNPLRPAHCFLVSFNKDNQYPQISKIFEEIEC